MMRSACPDLGRLRELLEDNLPEDENAQLTGHIDSCASCQKSLEELTAESESWSGLAQQVEQQPAPEPALLRAMQELESRFATIDLQGERTAQEETALEFLGPPEKPGHLGRLGHYEVLEVIGRGGMGVVLKAFDPALNRIVAIKVLAPQLANSASSRKRFIREAQAAAAISHDNIVTIHAVEEANGLPYLVMQYISGRSLQQRLDEAGALEPSQIVRIGTQTAAGLAAAHAQGLIHRDIKAANILLELAGVDRSPLLCDLENRHELERVKITDFGLARAIDEASLSQSGIVAGTPLYMSPEQISGGPIDHRSDLYSLGVLFYRMATGRDPFEGPTLASLLAQHLYHRPPRPTEVAPGPIPPWLENLILRLLQKDPAGRPQTAEEVIQCLDQGIVNQGADTPRSPQEEARLAALRRYKILDTDPEQGFDDLTSLASYVCGTPIALITLVDADRQWFKSKVGLSLQETARNISFCTHTIRESELLMVPDASRDERFAASPLVHSDPHVRFYAGIPLITPDGHALGAMCVMDRVPRQLSADQVSALAALSRLVLTQLELRRNLLELKDALADRKRPKSLP